jgi:hypothetical protein
MAIFRGDTGKVLAKQLESAVMMLVACCTVDLCFRRRGGLISIRVGISRISILRWRGLGCLDSKMES